jgi:hypothetical protein
VAAGIPGNPLVELGLIGEREEENTALGAMFGHGAPPKLTECNNEYSK